MNGNVTFKGRLNLVIKIPLYLFIVFAAIGAGIGIFNHTAGLCIGIFLILYLVIWYIAFRMSRRAVSAEVLRFSEYDQDLQAGLVEGLQLPYVILDPDGKILWMNRQFRDRFGKQPDYHKSITGIFQSLTKENLAKTQFPTVRQEQVGGRSYRIFFNKVQVEAYRGHLMEIRPQNEVITMLLQDDTQEKEYRRRFEQERIAVALVYVDNFDEISERMDSIRSSMLLALIDQQISAYFSDKDVILRKFDHDRYFIVFRQALLEQYRADGFSLTEKVKELKAGNEMAVTLSIGVGMGGADYEESHNYAKAAMDLASGRGGDQVVIKEGENVEYFGEAKGQSEKVSRVKARVKALALRELMQSCGEVMVMGHHIGDVDSFGSSVAVCHAAKLVGKNAHIVLDSVSSSIRPMKELFSPENGYPPDFIISPETAIRSLRPDTLVMVVDCNRPSYTECPQLLQMADTIVVFDHHRQGKEVITNAVLSYIEPYASSACEMMTEVLQYFSERDKLSGIEADCIYSGIMIDTNNFTVKTGVRTFEAAAYLRRAGADMSRVRRLMSNDLASSKARAFTVSNAEIYRGCFALAVCPSEGLDSPTVAAAQAANELLNISQIKASFVFTEYLGKIYISGRSISEINVQAIMERCGGGGHRNVAGAQMVTTVEGAAAQIREILDEMVEKGEIRI